MHFPRYWAKGHFEGTSRTGKTITRTAYGWSSSSIELAKHKGNQRAKAAFDARNTAKSSNNYYASGCTPLREEILNFIEPSESIILTRNRYGAIILNSSSVMFVDIDCPPPPNTTWIETIQHLLSPKKARKARELHLLQTQQRIQNWAATNPTTSFRLYRTHSGFRLLMTDQLHSPTAAETSSTLKSLDSDPLYISLTERQQCFRARLTPKPWRCHFHKPPHSFPYETSDQFQQHQHWLLQYQEKIKTYATCQFIKEFGTNAPHPEIVKVISIHDTLTLAPQKPLA